MTPDSPSPTPMTTTDSTIRDDEAFTITRTFDAPRAIVWSAFTEARHLAEWWGPKGFTMFHTAMDLRPGGTFHYGMRTPDGTNEMWGKFVYREIAPQERIVFVNGFSNPEGDMARAPFFGGIWPLEVLNVLTFEERDGKTTVTLRGGPIGATPEERAQFVNERPGMDKGFGASFDQLDVYLSSIR